MHAVAEVAEPGRKGLAVELFDAGVVGGGGDRCAGDGGPVLRRRVLECDLGGLVVGDVGEFGAVFVSDEEEVGSFALYNGETD